LGATVSLKKYLAIADDADLSLGVHRTDRTRGGGPIEAAPVDREVHEVFSILATRHFKESGPLSGDTRDIGDRHRGPGGGARTPGKDEHHRDAR